MAHVTDSLSMIFEGIFLLLRGWRRVEILYSDSTFNRSSGVSYLEILSTNRKDRNKRYRPSPLGMTHCIPCRKQQLVRIRRRIANQRNAVKRRRRGNCFVSSKHFNDINLNTYQTSTSGKTTYLCGCNIYSYEFFQYWGWCKYRYCETDKKTFPDAKNAALLSLIACPTEFIRRSINRSWRFMRVDSLEGGGVGGW